MLSACPQRAGQSRIACFLLRFELPLIAAFMGHAGTCAQLCSCHCTCMHWWVVSQFDFPVTGCAFLSRVVRLTDLESLGAASAQVQVQTDPLPASFLESIPAHDADHHTLNFAVVDDDGLEGAVGGLETDAAVRLAVERLQRCFTVGQQRDDAFAVAGGFAAFNEHVITIEDAFIFHGIAIDAQREGAASLPHARTEKLFEVQAVVGGVFFDGIPSSDLADQREGQRLGLIGHHYVFTDGQRACLVGIAPERAFLDQRFDVLEYRNLADAEFVGEFLHGWRITPNDS